MTKYQRYTPYGSTPAEVPRAQDNMGCSTGPRLVAMLPVVKCPTQPWRDGPNVIMLVTYRPGTGGRLARQHGGSELANTCGEALRRAAHGTQCTAGRGRCVCQYVWHIWRTRIHFAGHVVLVWQHCRRGQSGQGTQRYPKGDSRLVP